MIFVFIFLTWFVDSSDTLVKAGQRELHFTIKGIFGLQGLVRQYYKEDFLPSPVFVSCCPLLYAFQPKPANHDQKKR